MVRSIPRAFATLFMLLACVPAALARDAAVPMPACSVTSARDDAPVDLLQYRGKVLYIDFWASWCAPCVKAFPFMNSLVADFAARGLEVIAINLDEKQADARAFLAVRPARMHVVRDADATCARRFNVTGMPSSYLIDRKGAVRRVHKGFRSGDDAVLRTAIERLLDEGD